MSLFLFFVTSCMCGFLYLIEVFPSVSNRLEEVHLSDDITIRTTRLGSYEDSYEERPHDHEHQNSNYLSADDSEYIHQCMQTGSQEESDNAPEYEEEKLGIPHDPGSHIDPRSGIYPAQL